MNLNIKSMSNVEKLRTMELLWDDISRNIPDMNSPGWHVDILKEREAKLEKGEDSFVNWKEAKSEILDSIS